MSLVRVETTDAMLEALAKLNSGTSDGRPDRLVKPHEAKQAPEVAPNPVTDEHVVEHLHLLMSWQSKRLNVCPADLLGDFLAS